MIEIIIGIMTPVVLIGTLAVFYFKDKKNGKKW